MPEPTIQPNKKPPKTETSELDSPVLGAERTSRVGLIIGVVIILVTIALIGLYVWNQLMVNAPVTAPPTPERPTAAENNEPESTTAEAETEVLQVVSTSDELSAIEADLDATNLETIDTELNAIEAELE